MSERAHAGEKHRKKAPLERHAEWKSRKKRADPIAILEEQSATRMPDLVPIRYGRMAASPFAFYRGAAAVMAADLATTPVSGLTAQLCGDAHLMNFGMFATPERALIFGLNDFDETLPGPIEWDVKRLAASFEIAGRDLGFTAEERERAVSATVRSYREAMLEFAEHRDLEVWYARLPAEELRKKLTARGGVHEEKELKRDLRKALHRDHLGAFDRLVTIVDGEARFVSNPPVLVPVEELLDDAQRARYVEVIQSFLHQYRESLPPHIRELVERYRFSHIARKVVGVGSVGTRCWAVLMTGRDESDPLILQLKEAQPSVLRPYTEPTAYESQGRRVVEGQRLMQAASDGMLGWYRLKAWDDREHDFYVRQLWDGKSSVEIAHLSAEGFCAYGEACGWTVARGHARSGDRVAMAAYLGTTHAYESAIGEFAVRYAHTSEADHERLVEAIALGSIAAEPGV